MPDNEKVGRLFGRSWSCHSFHPSNPCARGCPARPSEALDCCNMRLQEEAARAAELRDARSEQETAPEADKVTASLATMANRLATICLPCYNFRFPIAISFHYICRWSTYMRKVTSILLGIAYLLVLARPVVPHVLFSLNQSYIQSSLCEQRDNLRSCCKGSCFMRKQLRQSLDGDAQRLALRVVSLELLQCVPTSLEPTMEMFGVDHAHGLLLDDHVCDQFFAEHFVPPPWKTLVA